MQYKELTLEVEGKTIRFWAVFDKCGFWFGKPVDGEIPFGKTNVVGDKLVIETDDGDIYTFKIIGERKISKSEKEFWKWYNEVIDKLYQILGTFL